MQPFPPFPHPLTVPAHLAAPSLEQDQYRYKSESPMSNCFPLGLRHGRPPRQRRWSDVERLGNFVLQDLIGSWNRKGHHRQRTIRCSLDCCLEAWQGLSEQFLTALLGLNLRGRHLANCYSHDTASLAKPFEDVSSGSLAASGLKS